MHTDFMMLVRYAVIAYMMYSYGAGSPLIEPTVDLFVATATVLWGLWDRVVWPWFKRLRDRVEEKLEEK